MIKYQEDLSYILLKNVAVAVSNTPYVPIPSCLSAGFQYRQRGILVLLNRQNKWSVACLVTVKNAYLGAVSMPLASQRLWLGNSASPLSLIRYPIETFQARFLLLC